MHTLEGLQRRLSVVEDLKVIVGTMKALAAVNIRQCEDAVAALARYNETVDLGIHVLLRHMPAPDSDHESTAWVAAVVLGSDQGLCGRFNENVTDEALHRLRPLRKAGTNVATLAIGMRTADLLDAAGAEVTARLPSPSSVGGLSSMTGAVIRTIDEWRIEHGPMRVLIVRNLRTTDAAAAAGTEVLLPVDLAYFRSLAGRRWPSRRLPTHTIAGAQLFRSLIRQHLFASIFRAGAESLASEHASRLAAMQAADRHIDDHLEQMRQEFRRLRQQSITDELLDVVAGYEVLRGDESARATEL